MREGGAGGALDLEGFAAGALDLEGLRAVRFGVTGLVATGGLSWALYALRRYRKLASYLRPRLACVLLNVEMFVEEACLTSRPSTTSVRSAGW